MTTTPALTNPKRIVKMMPLPNIDKHHRLTIAQVKKILERQCSFDYLPLPTTLYNHAALKQSHLNQYGGVYFLISEEGFVLYVGKAKRFCARIAAHLNRAAPNRLMAKYQNHIHSVFYIAVDKTLLPEIERQLIQWMQPPLNRCHSIWKPYCVETFMRSLDNCSQKANTSRDGYKLYSSLHGDTLSLQIKS